MSSLMSAGRSRPRRLEAGGRKKKEEGMDKVACQLVTGRLLDGPYAHYLNSALNSRGGCL